MFIHHELRRVLSKTNSETCHENQDHFKPRVFKTSPQPVHGSWTWRNRCAKLTPYSIRPPRNDLPQRIVQLVPITQLVFEIVPAIDSDTESATIFVKGTFPSPSEARKDVQGKLLKQQPDKVFVAGTRNFYQKGQAKQIMVQSDGDGKMGLQNRIDQQFVTWTWEKQPTFL